MIINKTKFKSVYCQISSDIFFSAQYPKRWKNEVREIERNRKTVELEIWKKSRKKSKSWAWKFQWKPLSKLVTMDRIIYPPLFLTSFFNFGNACLNPNTKDPFIALKANFSQCSVKCRPSREIPLSAEFPPKKKFTTQRLTEWPTDRASEFFLPQLTTITHSRELRKPRRWGRGQRRLTPTNLAVP